MPSAEERAAFANLIAPLPPEPRAFFAEAFSGDEPLPRTPADLFARLVHLASSAGIAEGRGGYPGGRGKPGWTEYDNLQRRHVAMFHALVQVFGPPSAALVEIFCAYERSHPPPVRRMGDGYEPHVDEVAGRLIYSLPVDSGFFSTSFSFPITARDLDRLLAGPYRRAVLEVAAHVVLQRSMVRGSAEVTGEDFARMVEATLHSEPAELRRFLAAVDPSGRQSIEHFAREAMERRAAKAN
ncbi:hypothetical protein [Aureimonas psammosilenae]|uniref:hypothetical protein n=1 Tax=Aureimonas psammosilenae TaxID=2495496 RepID=UPI001AED23DA|nr:hypothetical protein [Aureimonas psammosilenae]